MGAMREEDKGRQIVDGQDEIRVRIAAEQEETPARSARAQGEIGERLPNSEDENRFVGR